MSGFAVSGRPSTPPAESQSGGSISPSEASLATRAGDQPGRTVYTPHLFDLIFVAGSSNAVDKHVPSAYLTSASVDSSVLLGSGASFSASLRSIPKGPQSWRTVNDMGGWTVEAVVPARKRPQHVVYKTARVAFNHQGEAADGFRSAFQSVLTEIHALLYPPLQSHPNIIDCLGLAWGTNQFDSRHRLPAIVVEYADLGTLADVTKAHTLRSTHKLPVSCDIVAGLQAIHSADLVHGDIKAENVLMFSGPDRMVAKLADFGFSVVSETINADTWIGGTPPWQAPEADRSIAKTNLPLTDVYSVGFLLWSLCLGGVNPFTLLLPPGSTLPDWELLKRSENWEASYQIQTWGRNIVMDWQRSTTSLKLSMASPRPAGSVAEPREKAEQLLADVMFLSMLDQVFPHCLTRDPEQRSLEQVHQVLTEALRRYTNTGIASLNHHHNKGDSGSHGVDKLQKAVSWGNRGYKNQYLSWYRVRQLPPGLQTIVAGTLNDNHASHNFIRSALYINGLGCKADHTKGLAYLRRAADSGHALSAAHMYRLYTSCGISNIPDWPLSQMLSNYAKLGSRAALDDLKVVDQKLVPGVIKWLASTSGGVGSDWYSRRSMLQGLTQAELMKDTKLVAMAREVDVNTFRVNTRGDTLLHFAASCGRSNAVRVLITEHSADVEITNHAGDTPLICACRSGHGQIVAYLLKICKADPRATAKNGETAMHWLYVFDKASAKLLLADLLSGGADINSQTSQRVSHSKFPGRSDYDHQAPGTPLSWAIQYDKPSVVRELLSRGADPRLVIDLRSAPERAAHYHYHECLSALIENMEQVHQQDKSSNHKDKRYTLLYYPIVFAAVQSADKFSMILRNGCRYIDRLHSTLDILRGKTKGAVSIHKNFGGPNQNIFYFAVSQGYDEVIDYMLTKEWHDQEINEACGEFQRTPVLEAVRWNRRSLVDKLLEHGADIHASASNPYQPSVNNWTALHVLAEEGHDDEEALGLASHLVSLGVSIDSTPVAILSKPDSVLVPPNPDPRPSTMPPPNDQRQDSLTTSLADLSLFPSPVAESPLCIAVRYNSFRLANHLLSLGASINTLGLHTSLFSAPHPTTILGRTILANARFSADRLAFLLARPDVAFIVEPTRGLSALHRAAMAHDGVGFVDAARPVQRAEFDAGTNEEIMRILLGRFGRAEEVDALTKEGKTALMLAVEGGNVGAARALLEAGAETGVRDGEGRTAGDMARLRGDAEGSRIVRLLDGCSAVGSRTA